MPLRCNLVNLTITQSLFSAQCIITKLKRLFKKGSNSDPKNFWPISLLPVASKMTEKPIHLNARIF